MPGVALRDKEREGEQGDTTHKAFLSQCRYVSLRWPLLKATRLSSPLLSLLSIITSKFRGES